MRFRVLAPLAVAAVAVLAAAPAVAGTATPGSVPGGHEVRAVIALAPGVTRVAVPHGRVLLVLPHIGVEVAELPAGALAQLAAQPGVAGVTPDLGGAVTGANGVKDDGSDQTRDVLAAQWLGGRAGHDGVGQGVNVAVLDTGLTDTPALSRSSGRVTDGVDVSQLDATGQSATSGTFTDGYGHGTFIASLIAGGKVAGSGDRALGVAPGARIVVVKVADSAGRTSLAEVLAGMDWVAAHAQAPNGVQMIQVVNISLAVDRPTGASYGADPLTAGIDHLRADGVLVVASAGNTPGQVADPGLAPAALTVGALDVTKGKSVAGFSGSGNVDGVAKPDVVAPGLHVLGAMPDSAAIASANPSARTASGLFVGSGTSMATAVVAGVAAATYDANDPQHTSPLAVKSLLRKHAESVHDARAGAGAVHMDDGKANSTADLGESSLDSSAWQSNAWLGGQWMQTLSSSWSSSSWSSSSWSSSSWSASSWSSSSWSSSSWSSSSWSSSSWSSSSWSASSWSASSWSASGWGDQ